MEKMAIFSYERNKTIQIPQMTENLIEVPLTRTEHGEPVYIARGTFLLRKIRVGQRGKHVQISLYEGSPDKGGKMVAGVRPYSNDSYFTLHMWVEGELFYIVKIGQNGQMGEYVLTYEKSILAKERA
jgi:hypothetical protein